MRFLLSILLLCLVFVSSAFSSSSPQWTGLSLESTLMGACAILPENNQVFIASESSSGVNTVMTSTNAGSSFTALSVETSALMVMALAMASNTTGTVGGVALGAPSYSYTKNGKQFLKATEPGILMETSQSASPVVGVPGAFGKTGQFNGVNGIGLSTDGGVTYTNMKVGAVSTARYGAFPSANVLYVVAGQWPNNGLLVDEEGNYHVSGRHSVRTEATRANGPIKRLPVDSTDATTPPANSWFGEVLASKDGGKTWATQLTNSTWYPNQIQAVSEDVAFFVAESNNDAFVYATNNGGATWSEVLMIAGGSLMAAGASSVSDWWVAGGLSSGVGQIWHSTNGGMTWTEQSVSGVYFMSICMASPTMGFATGTTTMQYAQAFVLQ